MQTARCISSNFPDHCTEQIGYESQRRTRPLHLYTILLRLLPQVLLELRHLRTLALVDDVDMPITTTASELELGGAYSDTLEALRRTCSIVGSAEAR